MTHPTEPQTVMPPTEAQPQPQTQPPASPGPPQPGAQPEPGQTAAPEPESPEARLQRAEDALAAERRARKDAERQLAQVRSDHMTDAERALAKAREDGAAEARKAAGSALAAAEFRAAAVGVLADPDAALEALDLGRFVNDDGEVDRKKIADLVKRLATAAGGGKIPAGSRGAPPDNDFLRAALRSGR